MIENARCTEDKIIKLHSYNDNLVFLKNKNIIFDEDRLIHSYLVTLETFYKIIPWMIGKSDYYWKYKKNGSPFLVKDLQSKNPIAVNFSDIINHFQGNKILGFSPFLDDERVNFCAIDFDAHTSDKLTEQQNQQLINEAQDESKKVYNYLHSLNLPVILNSSGSNGRHIRLLCIGAKAKDMRIFLKYILEKMLGDKDKHEIFPKQDNLNTTRLYGNQIKGFLGKHQKKNSWSYIIVNDNMLNFKESVEYVCKIIDNFSSYSDITIPKEDYERIKKEDEKIFTHISMLNNNELNYSNDGEVPNYCDVVENVLVKYCLPSCGKYTRHHCLDPNIASYSINHIHIKEKYAIIQNRIDNNGKLLKTAFDNWSNYWNGVPKFKCEQILGYLKYHAKKDKHCKEALNRCVRCEHFLKYLETKEDSKGWAIQLSIISLAGKYKFTKCPRCNYPFVFIDKLGYFKCSNINCKVEGKIKDFVRLLLKNKIAGVNEK